MGTMTFDADLLSTNGYEGFNLTLFTGTIGDSIELAMETEFESWTEHYTYATGKDLGNDWFDHVTWDYDAMYKDLANDLPDILEETYDDLFTTDPDGSAPVIIGEIEELNPRDLAGWGREVIMAKVKIDGDKLKALADKYWITDISDGHGISGFFRTADDSYWSQIRVIETLMKAMDDLYAENLSCKLDEWACADGRVGDFIEYGVFDHHIEAATEWA